MTVFNILGQLGGGFLGDRFSKRMLAALAMLMHSAALLILAYATTMLPVYAFAVLHGTAWGLRGPMMTTIRADYFGRASFATIMGFSSLLVMVGNDQRAALLPALWPTNSTATASRSSSLRLSRVWGRCSSPWRARPTCLSACAGSSHTGLERPAVGRMADLGVFHQD